jgi:hypothetical protein
MLSTTTDMHGTTAAPAGCGAPMADRSVRPSSPVVTGSQTGYATNPRPAQDRDLLAIGFAKVWPLSPADPRTG